VEVLGKTIKQRRLPMASKKCHNEEQNGVSLPCLLIPRSVRRPVIWAHNPFALVLALVLHTRRLVDPGGEIGTRQMQSTDLTLLLFSLERPAPRVCA